MILQHHHLRYFIRYCFPLFFFSLCWVWLRIVTLPSLGYFYLNSCCCLRYLPQNVCFIVYLRPRCVDSRNVLAIDLQVHELFLVCIGEREPRSMSARISVVLKVHALWLLYLQCFWHLVVKGESILASTMKKTSEYLVSRLTALSHYMLSLFLLSLTSLDFSLPPSIFFSPSLSLSLSLFFSLTILFGVINAEVNCSVFVCCLNLDLFYFKSTSNMNILYIITFIV